MKRLLSRVVILVALLGGTSLHAEGPRVSSAVVEGRAAAKPSTRKKRPKAQSRSSSRKNAAPPDVLQEQSLHEERLAIIGRMRELNELMQDAELAARIRRIEDLEKQRHAMSMDLAGRKPGGSP